MCYQIYCVLFTITIPYLLTNLGLGLSLKVAGDEGNKGSSQAIFITLTVVETVVLAFTESSE